MFFNEIQFFRVAAGEFFTFITAVTSAATSGGPPLILAEMQGSQHKGDSNDKKNKSDYIGGHIIFRFCSFPELF